MKKKSQRTVVIVVAVLAAAVLGVGGFFIWNRAQGESDGCENTEADEETADSGETPGDSVNVDQPENAGAGSDLTISDLSRPSFYNAGAELNYNADLVPCVPEYTVEADLSNIVNADRYSFSDRQIDLLVDNGFYVSKEGYANEFFQIYEENRYFRYANFVTVDSLMHTYHLYFSYLLRNTEKQYLSDALADVSKSMLSESLAQYEVLKGSEWEEAAKRNVIFFAVGARLQDDTAEIPDFAAEIAEQELQLINGADGIARSPLMNGDEDYSQYKPRGYYDGDEQLEKYFRAMMWYGRIGFMQKDELSDRSALLMTLALNNGALEQWESIYSVTSFFAGASDDLGYYEYLPVIAEAYGENVIPEDLVGDEEAWRRFHELTAGLEPPVINSLSDVRYRREDLDSEDNKALNYRFMGQRFSIDAAVMQGLISDAVLENSRGELRMLPDVLDVPAALGSDTALDILETQGDTEYEGYMENMEQLRQQYNNASPELWSASLYACWLDTLRPLLTEKGEGYPFFMQTESWWQKDLETFAGSYTELKHDTVLYSKQVLAEMGGGDEEIDDRGYVQPEPLVYAKFSLLARQTADGLAAYGMISDTDLKNLQKLEELADQLVTISEKELLNETLTDEEYELIRGYGGSLEHFWMEAIRDQSDSEYIAAAEFPCPLVVDIATNIEGSVLEAATGRASEVYVAVPVDGTIRICSGAVYTFYQFEWPINDRLTDTQWRQMMGWEINDNNEYERTAEIAQPDWTQEYRAGYEQ